MTSANPSDFVILHLGLGSFHRAHQAAYLQKLIDAGDTSWSITAANLRPDMLEVENALRAQKGRYTLETVSPAGAYHYQRIEAIREILAYDPSLAAVIARGADPRTRIVSFTVTEAGYYLGPYDRLDLAAEDLSHDLERARDGLPGSTIYGAVTAILRARRDAVARPVTLLNCDNLRHNGGRFRKGLLEFIGRAGDTGLQQWVIENTRFPDTMVDRITPRPSAELRQRVREAVGWDDAPVTAESFIQWVIKDDFANGRPAWEKVGVQMVASVWPFEEAKIRILNATHSCIAWAGTLAGLQYIHEGVQHTRIRRMAFDCITDDVIPCLQIPGQPSPVDLPSYRDIVLERFGNPAIRDTNERVVADGFAKLAGFVAPTVRERLGRGESIESVAVLPALFMAFLQRWHRGTLPFAYRDQGMDEALAHEICSGADPLAALAMQRSLWAEAAGHADLVAALHRASTKVQKAIGVQA